MSKRIKVGIIGTGGRGTLSFGQGLLCFPNAVEITALCDKNPLRIKGSKALTGLTCEEFNDHETLLAKADCDTVIVTTPDFTHEEITIDCLRAGKNVLCEKPMAISTAQCDRMMKAERESGRMLMVAFNMRHHAVFMKVQQIMASGKIGRPIAVQFLDYYPGGNFYFRRWHRLKENSGGLLIHKGSHDFDLFNWIIGAKPTAISAFSSVGKYNPIPGAGVRCRDCSITKDCVDYFDLNKEKNEPYRKLYRDAESVDQYYIDRCVYTSDKDTGDHSTIIIEYDNGCHVSYLESFLGNVTETGGRYITIFAEHGQLWASDNAMQVKVMFDKGQPPEVYDIKRNEADGHGGADDAEIRAFIESLQQGRHMVANSEAGRLAVMMGEAAEKSAEEKRVIPLKG
ncbi:MAG: Gfo/Idh/MocA family oxidoreductase [Verrucomicrobiae bacterium]|nr:Gfo/Idh/MocA family oxidoreductase [Verrucomicrobiae bacterium]